MKYKGSLVVVEDITRSRLLYETILKQKVIADYGEDYARPSDQDQKQQTNKVMIHAAKSLAWNER